MVNADNGCAGPPLDALEKHLPFRFIKIHHEPDPTFPHGVPNPLLPENRLTSAQAVLNSFGGVHGQPCRFGDSSTELLGRDVLTTPRRHLGRG